MTLRIRRAEPRDEPSLGRFSGALARLHHEADPKRFVPVNERGYGRWLASEMQRDGAIVLVAEDDAAVVGYAYATLEGRDWNALLAEHGALQDIFVADEGRRRGAGGALLDAILAALKAKGAERVVLSTMVQNTAAQALFGSRGFRPTMLEMTRELD